MVKGTFNTHENAHHALTFHGCVLYLNEGMKCIFHLVVAIMARFCEWDAQIVSQTLQQE